MYTQLSDEDIMLAIIRHHDEKAFAILYQRYGSRMYRYFYRMLRQNAAQAADFTQDLFIKIIEKNHYFDPSRRFKTWIYTLALNMCRNEYRKKHPVWTALPEEKPVSETIALPDRIDQEQFNLELRQALNKLSEQHRQCFILRYQEELSIAEIADIMNCPDGTIKSRLHHALRQLAEQLEMWRLEKQS
jgi:RNA polymerase sigma-70 factor (ECF subfamily)